MNTNLKFSINTDFELNQDIKKLSKQISKFLRIYAYKSAYLHHETKSIKHNQYLDITARFFGYSDYNQYHKSQNKNTLTIYKLIKGFNHFIINLNINSNHDKGDLEQITKTFYLYLTLTEQELSKKKSNTAKKIERRIAKLKKDKKTRYESSEIKMFYNMIKTKKLEYTLSDYRSVDFEDIGAVKDLNAIFKEYYDYKNTLSIKKYLKDKFFKDDIGENLYLFEDFILNDTHLKEYIPYESIEYSARKIKFLQNGFNKSLPRSIIQDFHKKITQNLFGKHCLIKGIFHAIDCEGISKNYYDISRNKEGFWTSFDITLSNNDNLNVHIYEDGYVLFHKKFNGENEYYDLGFLFSSENLRFTIPMVERNKKRKERFRFFYPKYEDDKFIFKMVFEEYSGQLVFNRHGLINEKNEIVYSYKYIMQILYNKRQSKLYQKIINIYNKKDFYKIYFPELILQVKKELSILKEKPEELKLNDELEEKESLKTNKKETLTAQIKKLEKEIEKLKSFYEDNYKN